MKTSKINLPDVAAPVMDLYAHVVVAQNPRFALIAGQVALDVDGVPAGEGDHASHTPRTSRPRSSAQQGS